MRRNMRTNNFDASGEFQQNTVVLPFPNPLGKKGFSLLTTSLLGFGRGVMQDEAALFVARAKGW